MFCILYELSQKCTKRKTSLKAHNDIAYMQKSNLIGVNLRKPQMKENLNATIRQHTPQYKSDK